MVVDGKIKVGIVGAAGYTAGELLRILVNHPCVEIVFAQSGSHAGEPVWAVHSDLIGETDLQFSAAGALTGVGGDTAPAESILASLRLRTAGPVPPPATMAPDGTDSASLRLRTAGAASPPANDSASQHQSSAGLASPGSEGAPAGETTATLGSLRGGTGAALCDANGGASRSEAVELPETPSPEGETLRSEAVELPEAPSQEGPDVIFVCSGHGKSKDFVHSLPADYKGAIIDLSNDFRLKADAEDFVYGLPEAFRSRIKGAKHIANPGCFATSIQLALLPVAKADILPEVHVTGITGSTGAGQAPSATTHFSWRSDNLSVYKAFTHQHLGEIGETLSTLAPDWNGEINFVPVRGDFARGILASVYFDCDLTEEEAIAMYKEYYKDEPFVHVIDGNPDLKMVVNTNKCVLGIRKYGRKLHVVSVIDNLVKGASGQAVQNMNLVFGLPEDTGLHLKGTRF